MISNLVRYTNITDIIGDMLKVKAKGIGLEELAIVHHQSGSRSLAKVVQLEEEYVILQIFSGSKGVSTNDRIHFLHQPMQVVFCKNILGRIFNGIGESIDAGPSLDTQPHIELSRATVNPMLRVQPKQMIETKIPMIDLFNTLVESQKIPIFSISGEPYNTLLARIGFQADADIVVFGGMGLIFDDYHFFKTAFEEHNVSHKTIMFVNRASDPTVERLMIPDLALSVAEKFAVQEGKRVLVLLTDMTAYADAMKEVGIAQERIPAVRGYLGDLYTQLARRYEKACDYKGAGSVTILSVTTMPGDDVTHPVPDNTGYITEGQYYLHGGSIDPFGSLSRLKQNVIGKETREDHSHIMNGMIRFYSSYVEAKQKQSMAFELSEFDQKLLKFGRLFEKRFMDIEVSLPLNDALDLCWQTLAECFEENELLIKQKWVDKYFPKKNQEIEKSCETNNEDTAQ